MNEKTFFFIKCLIMHLIDWFRLYTENIAYVEEYIQSF